MKTITFLILIFMVTVFNIFSQTAPPLETGVSHALAKWRAANYSDVRYKLNITLEKGAPLMKGEIEISVKLTDEGAKNDLVLDWRTTQFANDKDKPFAKVIAVNGKNIAMVSGIDSVNYYVSNEHLGVSRFLLKTGENTIKIEFASPIKTSGSAITRYVDKEDGAEYIYSLFVPSDASTAFPVFDQPDLKARFQLNITAPIDWKIISNARYLAQTSNDNFPEKPLSEIQLKEIEKKIAQGDYRTASSDLLAQTPPKGTSWTYFRETKPISTYVFAFAAGSFASFQERDFSDVVSVHDMQIYVRKSQAEKFKQHSKEVFRLNRKGVKFLESYFDYKFPFPKYDLVLIPEFPFGGMEHAGATFLRETSVIFPTEPTKNDYVSRANLIFHEAAHQWFGDTVTMKWFDDLWLKEGFAEFMAYKTLAQVMPEYNAWKIFYERNKQAAYLTDSTKGTTPIYQEIPNLSSAKSAYGNIVYRKAPSFLKQAEFYLGEKEFQTAVRAFLKKHQFANAEWTDLVKEFQTASKQELKGWANVWVKQEGVYIFKARIIKGLFGNLVREDGTPFDEKQRERFSVVIGARLVWEDEEFQFSMEGKNLETKFKVLTLLKDKTTEIRDFQPHTFSQSRRTDQFLNFDKEPLFIFPNYQDYGYGIFLLDEKSRAYVLENIQNEKDDFLRSMMWGSLWDSVREGELDPQAYVELVIKNINVETDESTIQTLLGRTSTAMNYYLSEPSAVADGSSRPNNKSAETANGKLKPSATADGSDIAAKLETLLIEKMRNAPTVGQRITFYRAFLNIAASEKARTILKQFDDSKLDIIQTKGFQLKTKDKFDIITKLLILGDKDAPQLLAELEKNETSDEAKRYAYAAKAGIATAENKLKFWNDFVANKEISESWIESAFVSFNSPKHSDLTLPYLEKALNELPNLKRNRKIFFVNGWLAAFIGGQKSEQAFEIINKFLADNPNLDKDLRLKILENSDNLERSLKIRAKFAVGN